MLKVGLVGLPNAGKSTLFNALVSGAAEVADYPFTTIDPNVGVVAVPDERLQKIASLVGAQKATPATVQFVDIAGLVKGASKGEGLGNQFLANIREVDAICHVVRCFGPAKIPHVYGSVDPVRDAEIVNEELILADLDTIDRRMAKTERMLKSGERKYQEEMSSLRVLKDTLSRGRAARLAGLEEMPEGLFLLTAKPMLYVANVSEEEVDSSPEAARLEEYARRQDAPVVVVSARIESELAELSPGEAAEVRKSYGLSDPSLNRVVRVSYDLLGLVTFFTTKGPETRAWAVRAGTTAVEAAGKIHSDMEKGFIKAEVISYRDLLAAGSMGAAHDRGLVRVEGRDYMVADGDVILFRFRA
ncbi:MAG TPA: redox-regulated ATPase YchF [Firmicutes bacterium]|nr:redox-regulated ATPase YchF [Bacillota bacterium]